MVVNQPPLKSTIAPIDRSIIDNLICGTAPERRDELRTFWNEYDPTFVCIEDRVGVTMRATGKRVEFDHKTMAVFWVLGFAAWRAYELHIPHVLTRWLNGGSIDPSLLSQDPEIEEAQTGFDSFLYFQ